MNAPLPPAAAGTAAGLPPFPSGWYAACFAAELPPGGVRRTRFMGRELVLFRTRAGEAAAADAYCPHLGAHLGHGGRVDGERLRCPFHGFLFTTAGACAATGYGTKPPPTARLQVVPVRETNGILLLHHAADGQAPTWEVPNIDHDGWSPPIFRRFTLSAHPQATTENSVDLGHFAVVHGYRDVRMLRELVVDGPYLSTAYRARRPAPLLGDRLLLEFEFETHIHGLGYSLVEVRVPRFDVRARLWVLPTPHDAGHTTLSLAASGDGRSGDALRPLRGVPRRVRAAVIARGLLHALAQDARQDFAIWEHGRVLPRPALAQGDGPIPRYRAWAAGFYAGGTRGD